MRSEAERPGRIGDYWLSKDPKSPHWYRTWFDSDRRQTRRATLGTDDQNEAVLLLAEWYVLNVRLEKASPQDVMLSVVLDRYYEHHAKAQCSEAQARIALRYWRDFYGDAVVSELTVQRQEAFIAHLRTLRLSNGYIQRIVTIGTAALNWARRRQELTDVPHILTVPGGSERDRHLSIEEAVALWKAVDSPHMAAYLAIAFNTAARPDAILDLTAERIDRKTRLVMLNPAGRAQTKKYRPTLPLTRDLERSTERLSGPLVAWRGKPVQSIKTGWRALRARAGLSTDVVPYTVRHTVASEMRAAGVPPWEVAGFLGHKIAELRTTERYARFAPDYLGRASEAVDAYMVKIRSALELRRSTL